MKYCTVFAMGAAALVTSSCWSEGDPFETSESDGICLAPDCADSVTVDVRRRDEEIFPPGDYLFSVEIDAGVPIAATCTLSSNAAFSCAEDAGIDVQLNASFDRFIVRIDNRAPDQLFISVSFNDGEIGTEILAPDYAYVGSNDPDCNLTCMQGTAEMRTTSPNG